MCRKIRSSDPAPGLHSEWIRRERITGLVRLTDRCINREGVFTGSYYLSEK
jgi:hypothetical protein